jgi:hypothetical protein
MDYIEIIKLIAPGGIMGGITGIIGGYFAIQLQRKKNRPKPTTHKCRIMDGDIYTYFDPDNNSSKPACPYLSKSGECKFNPTEQNSKLKTEWDADGHIKFWSIAEKKYILKVNNNKCYLSLWNQKTK